MVTYVVVELLQLNSFALEPALLRLTHRLSYMPRLYRAVSRSRSRSRHISRYEEGKKNDQSGG